MNKSKRHEPQKPVRDVLVEQNNKGKKHKAGWICPQCGNDLQRYQKKCPFCRMDIDWSR